MKHHQRPDKASETPRDQYRTPKRPSAQPLSSSSKSTTSKRKASPRLSLSGRPWKRTSLPNSSREQSTLTQIDFVTQTPCSNHDELDYIDENGVGGKALGAAESVHIGDESGDDSDYRLPPQVRSGFPNLEIKDDHTKRRRRSAEVPRVPERGSILKKSQKPRPSNGRGKRKSTDKPPPKRDKTLTQMDFVRRYITIDDDDDNNVNMKYLQPAPQKVSGEGGQQAETAGNQGIKTQLPSTSTKRTRGVVEEEIDLSTGELISQPGETQNTSKQHDTQDPPKSDIPITPRKPRRLEIPSSQSPESPGLAIITSSQFRSATHSPQKTMRSNIAHPDNCIKKESPSSLGAADGSLDQDRSIQDKPPTPNLPTGHDFLNRQPSLSTGNATSRALFAAIVSQELPPREDEPQPERTQRERIVVYETDAETDNDEFEDDSENEPGTPSRPCAPLGDSNEAQIRPQSPSDDSQYLPLPGPQSYDDPDSAHTSEAPMSDASLFYQRVQPATQFPHEPIPTLNTQKLSELFPNEGSTQHPRRGTANHIPKHPVLSSQTQPQSQETDQIELVPESSPARDQENSVDAGGAGFQRPQPLGSVVQVESSQPVDRGHNGGGVSSRSHLLTSSVMESIPLPNFWMGSQDSVGEPYSLPER
ncbi:uncharacterized protein N7482_004349 [Penicillium canariense]|uniref:Uncharacterized protein n=1 Tax=Penicillium canariense TaxID=189055 RepID=A0A9W9I8Z6_9EURO|nr:uncharacterized protein N7482_004349 [Penicillium canariense]KAJ5168755.1 hypothetical protein N7482_004349 [Penicillium canariense]